MAVRRARLLLLLLFAVIAYVLYTRNTTPVDDYRQYFKDKASIGGGSVIRPKPDEAQNQAPAAPGPENLQRPAPVELESPAEETTTTSPKAAVTPDPTPEPQPPSSNDGLPLEVGEGRVEVPMAPWKPQSAKIHWSKQPEQYPVSTTIQLPTGTPVPIPRLQRNVNKLSAAGADKQKLAAVKAAAEHAWIGYRDNAWEMDEIKPVSGRYNNPFNGWGATLVDALDTLWIMGMEKEFEEAVKAVGNIDFTTSIRGDIPIFETTIRYLGGLIAAYDVSGRKHITLLDKAVELAEVMFGIFDTPNRMPLTYYRWKPSYASQPHRASTRVVLAEIGTLNMEFTRLAQITKEPKYYDAIARITDALEEWQNSTRVPGMWPTSFDASGCGKSQNPTGTRPLQREPVPDGAAGSWMAAGEPVSAGKVVNDPDAPSQNGLDDLGSTKRKRDGQLITDEDFCVPQGFQSTSRGTAETFTLSGASDSTYEYLPKEYILLGGQVDQYRSMYIASADAAIEQLVYKPMTKDQRDILMVGEAKISPNYSQPIETREYMKTFKPEAAHLACFAGGMFAIGGTIFNKPEHVEIGSKLTDGCVWAYNVTETGIMPEGADLMPCPDTWGDCPWDEEAYWNVLDPYASSRLAEKTPAISLGDSPQTPPSQIGPQMPDVNKRDAEDKVKRQPPVADPAAAAPPRPRPAYFTDDDDVSSDPDVGLVQYTPEPPLSHKDYVEKKIEEERLPPGFTRITSRRYILRPEAIESVFYLYRITGNQYWRDVGWNMFTSIDRHTRALHGHSAIDDVTKSAPDLLDGEESFWLAETLKYFYLLYDDPAKWSLDEWVITTEAHLFQRPKGEFADS